MSEKMILLKVRILKAIDFMGKISQFVKASLLLLAVAGCSSSENGGRDAEMDRFK